MTMTLEETIKEFEALQRRAINLSPIHGKLGLAMMSDVDERYNLAPSTVSGGPVYGGEFWQGLTEEYMNANPRRRNGQLGRDTGASEQSFTIGKQGNVFTTSPTEVIFGSNLPEVKGFDTGGRNPDRARPLIFIHDLLIETLENITIDWILRGVK